jgi:hypothetical protein
LPFGLVFTDLAAKMQAAEFFHPTQLAAPARNSFMFA